MFQIPANSVQEGSSCGTIQYLLSHGLNTAVTTESECVQFASEKHCSESEVRGDACSWGVPTGYTWEVSDHIGTHLARDRRFGSNGISIKLSFAAIVLKSNFRMK